MRIEERFTLEAPVDATFAFLSDVDRVAECVPGVGDVEQLEDGSYSATLRVQMGPIRAAFAGEMTLEASEAPYRIQAEGKGRDPKSGSRAEVAFSGDLEPGADGHTLVSTSADVVIRGRLGQFGTGVIQATAKELIREFVACANVALQQTPQTQQTASSQEPPEDAAAAAPAQPAIQPVVRQPEPTHRVSAGFVLRVLRHWGRAILDRVTAALRRLFRS